MAERQVWGEPLGVPEGADITLEAKLTINGVVDTARVTSSGTKTLWVSDSVLNGGVALITNEGSDSFVVSTGVAKWNITDTQSSGWEAGYYEGDIKLVDSGGLITIWPVALRVRSPRSS